MRLCRRVTLGFGVLYLLALVLFVIGTFGLFGQERDPMSAVFVVLLGQPWVQFAGGLPESARPFAAALSPAVNLAVLWLVCRLFARLRT